MTCRKPLTLQSDKKGLADMVIVENEMFVGMDIYSNINTGCKVKKMDKKMTAIIVVAIAVVIVVAAAVIMMQPKSPDSKDTYTVTGTIDHSGTVTNSSQTVDRNGDAAAMVFTPAAGYHFVSYSLNGAAAVAIADSPATFTYTFQDVVADGTISVNTSIYTGSMFYFEDNFENDAFKSSSAYNTQSDVVNPGVWSKGTGSDITVAFKDACKQMGMETIVTSEGKITSVDDVVDGNLYLWAWSNNAWTSTTSTGTFLTLNDISEDCEYVALVHGATTTAGGAPAVNTDPTKMKWYFGQEIDHPSGERVIFYVGDNFVFSELKSERTDASDPLTLLVDGLWISGYAERGSLVEEAFVNAMDAIGYKCTVDGGFIKDLNSVTDGNFVQGGWNTETKQWDQNYWLLNVNVEDIDYMCIIHGAWGGGASTPPYPDKTPNDIIWFY